MTDSFSEEFVNSLSEICAFSAAVSPKQQKYVNSDKTPEPGDVVVWVGIRYSLSGVLEGKSVLYLVREVCENDLTVVQIEDTVGIDDTSLGEAIDVKAEDFCFIKSGVSERLKLS